MEKLNFGGIKLTPLAAFNTIVHPSVTDILPAGSGQYDAVMQDFTVLTDVPYTRPIIDFTKLSNTLRRRDASCDLIYKQVGNTALRYVTTSQLYAGTRNCMHEMFQGGMQYFAGQENVIIDKITPFFQDSNRTDIGSNAWYGDVNRAATSQFSTNAFDGVFKWIAAYVNAGVIAAGQTYAIPHHDFYDPANYLEAFTAIVTAYQKQTPLMKAFSGLDKVIYCDQATYEGYCGYVRTLGNPYNAEALSVLWGNGKLLTMKSYNGIPIVPVPLWNVVLDDINGAGSNYHNVILTVRKNFIFATDTAYGEGQNFDMAFRVFYWDMDLTWYYQQFLKAGTQIALPEYIVVGS